MCGGVGVRPDVVEPAADLVDRGLQREDLAGDELVVVVGADGMPVDAVGGDGDLGDEGLDGEFQAGGRLRYVTPG